MAVGPDQDGMIAGRGAVRDPPADLGGDPVRLLGARGEGLQPDGPGDRRDPLRTEPLHDAGPDLQTVRVVEADEPVGGIEDRRERPVVASQDDGPRAEVAVLEGQDVVHGRAAERVDRLVVVAHHRHVAVLVGERGHELGLGAVGVLELVDEDVPEAPRDRRPGRRRGADETEGERHLVAEVDAAVGGHERLVRGVRTGQLRLPSGRFVGGSRGLESDGIHAGRLGHTRSLGRHAVRMGEEVGRRDVLVLAAAEQRGERGQEAGRVAQRPVRVQLELEQVLAQEDDDLRARQHPQVRGQAELQRVLADDPVAEGVEGRDGGVRVAVRDQLVHPDRHLLGRLVRERQGQDLRGPRAPRGDEPGDPAGDDLGLAGPGARHHEERTLAVGHGAELVRVETPQQCLQPRWRRIADGRGHHRHQLRPRRQLIQGRWFASPRTGADHAGGRRGGGCRGGHDGSIAVLRDS